MNQIGTDEMYLLAKKHLDHHKIKKIPFDIFDLCRKDKITLVPYSSEEARSMAELIGITDWMDKTDGLAVRVEEMTFIFWDDLLPMLRQRFTVAHELGHIILGHIDIDKKLNHCTCHDCGVCTEWQADSFAFQLLAPHPKDFLYTKERSTT